MHRLELACRAPNGDPLGIDIAWFGATKPRRVLIHSSGLHGVEGFAGSAIQLQLLDNLPQLLPDAAMVLVHVLNPYGMAYLRRVNESNVDLNRNFRTADSYSGAPPLYPDSLLNPRTPPSLDFFHAKAAFAIARHGFSALKQSIAGGQYEFPKGLFFGGKKLEDGPVAYEAFLRQHLTKVEQAICIDVHTGLGKFAEDMLLVEQEEYDRLRNLFGGRVTPMNPGNSAAYRVEGSIESMLSGVFSSLRPVVIGQEFGTYGGFQVLHALREENRWHHYGSGTLDHPTKSKLKEMFCPDNDKWRRAVLARGSELVQETILRVL